MHKTNTEYIRERQGTMVLSAVYLASTTSLLIVSVVEPPGYKGNYHNEAQLKYVSECRKFSYCYGLCFPDTWATIYNT